MPAVLAATGQPVADAAKTKFGEKIKEVLQGPSDVTMVVQPGAWKEVHEFLKSDGFDMLSSLAAVDWLKEGVMWIASHVFDTVKLRRIAVRTEVPRDAARLASLTPLWRAADWHERECFDLSGVTFDGHPDLRRILCPDDWEGHALRKDYKAPDYYHGIQNNVNLIDLDNRPPIPDIV
jgi:NADH-quinone oxidoreductase subunit C